MSETRVPFTTVTWASLTEDHAYLSQKYASVRRIGWEAQTDLAHELVEKHENLTIEQARVLVSFTVTQVPLIMSWTNANTPVAGTTETVTAAVVVEYLSSEQVRIRHCGFAHWINLSSVVGAEVFETVQTYS